MKILIVIFCALVLTSCTKIEQRIADSVISKKYGEIVLHKWKIVTAGTTYDPVTFHIVKEGDQDAKLFEGQNQIGFWEIGRASCRERV